LRAGKRKNAARQLHKCLIGLQHNHFPASGRFRWFGPLVAALRRIARLVALRAAVRGIAGAK
jgi:hypothetical protein